MKYDYKAVEAKWQKVWEDEKTFHVEIECCRQMHHHHSIYLSSPE